MWFLVGGGSARDGAPLMISELAADDPHQLATMNWDDLRAHAERGVQIESHGVSHAHLPTVGDDELRRELRDAKQEIEDELAVRCTELAYPYGEHDDRVRAAARSAGYERAFALWRGSKDPYSSPRLDLYRRHSPVRTLLRLYT